MKVEIWSDYVCPFCYIGERKLALALEKTGMKEDVEVVFNSFELDPNAKKSYDENITQLMAKKYGLSMEQATAEESAAASERTVKIIYNTLKKPSSGVR